jgi:hypothetical protein
MGTSENAASHEGRRSNFARVKDGGRAPLVITCEYDRLRNEATAYDESLNSAGGLLEHFEVARADVRRSAFSRCPARARAIHRFACLEVDTSEFRPAISDRYRPGMQEVCGSGH